MHTSEFLNISAAIVPDRTAVIFEEKRFTYLQIEKRSTLLANALKRMGVNPKDRIAIMDVNCNEHIELYFACAKLDAIYVPLNFRGKRDEIEFILRDSRPKVLLAGSRYLELLQSLDESLSSSMSLIRIEESEDNSSSYKTLLDGSEKQEIIPAGLDEDVIILMYTAGTTGKPKGVMLTHENLSSYILSNVNPADPVIEERNIITVPLYHIAGVQAVLAGIYSGRTLIIQRQFDADDWLKLVETEKVNRAMMVPTMLKNILESENFAKYDTSSIKVITYGAAPMPLQVIKRAIEEFPNAQFINAFGQTETASTITMLPPEDHQIKGSKEEIEKKLRRLSSIGKPLDDVEIRIVDDYGKEVDKGEIGEIVASGPRLMKGYWNQKKATSNTLKNGWLHTGDLGYVDEDGYIFLSGRAKDFIKRGGEMISPEEVEQVLHSHPAIDEAAIIGIPDETWGEVVRAIVVLKQNGNVTEEELIQYCRDKLSSFKKPESVIFVEELPRNTLGKVIKRQLRETWKN